MPCRAHLEAVVAAVAGAVVGAVVAGRMFHAAERQREERRRRARDLISADPDWRHQVEVSAKLLDDDRIDYLAPVEGGDPLRGFELAL